VKIYVETENIDQLEIQPDIYSWQFPILAPDKVWPIDTSFRVVLCKTQNEPGELPCQWPDMEEDAYQAIFPLEGPTWEEYQLLVETEDPSKYYLSAGKQGCSADLGVVLVTVLFALGLWID